MLTRSMQAVRAMVAGTTHWFDAGTMRFFRSRVARRAYQGPHALTFVSSERYDDATPRLYTVRCIVQREDGWHVATVGEFQAYATRREADRAARQYAERGTL